MKENKKDRRDQRIFVIAEDDGMEFPLFIGKLEELEVTGFTKWQIRSAITQKRDWFGRGNKKYKFFVLEE